MPSRKRLEDLEYNVFRHNNDDSGSGAEFSKMYNSGCLTILAGIVLTAIIVVALIGFMQIGRNAPAASCAAKGCSNKPKPGSNYCWIHSQSYNSRSGSSSGITQGSGSGSGSLIG